jgi:pimeloyl-ACP methyl ester carboxylesterase
MLPLIITHSWPGSVIELLEVVGPLTDPAGHGGQAEDAFDLVLPSLPGYGFSDEPTSVGWDPGRVARAWPELMHRLGYTRYAAQGGDIGAAVTDTMAIQAPSGLAGIHLNFLRRPPPEVAAAQFGGAPVPRGSRRPNGRRSARSARSSSRATSQSRASRRRRSATP